MKKGLCFVLAMFLVSTLVFVACDNTPEITDGLEFVSYKEGTCVVEGLGTYSEDDLIIPEKSPQGDVVTAIGASAFEGCTNLTSVTIPDSVKSIGVDAFLNCSGLKSVTIGNGVEDMGGRSYGSGIYQNPFWGCSSLTSIKVGEDNVNYHSVDNCVIDTKDNILVSACQTSIIPDGVEKILYGAFAGCSDLKDITIPDSVVEVGPYAFAECVELTSITFPESVEKIGIHAFSGCVGLTSITVPYSANLIEPAFIGCTGLTSITVSDQNKTYHSIDNCLIETQTNKLILGCQNSVIPNSVTSIGGSAFSGCAALTEVIIPVSVAEINPGAFSGCTDLKKITVAKDNPTYHSVDNCVIETATNTLIVGCQNSSIADSVIIIGEQAFADCSELSSIHIPVSVEWIQPGAFAGCSGLSSITVAEENATYHSSDNCIIETETNILVLGCKNSIVPKDIAMIDMAFAGCTGITKFSIPSGVDRIADKAFSDCTGLTSITIPASVRSLGENTFQGCINLSDVYFAGSEEQWARITAKIGSDLSRATIHYNYVPEE